MPRGSHPSNHHLRDAKRDVDSQTPRLRRLKSQIDKPPDQDAIYDMDDDIDDVISENIHPSKIIIQGKGELTTIPRPGEIKKMGKMTDLAVLRDIDDIIK